MNRQYSLATIVLAAGKGTRMKSAQAKVLHEVFFEPMVHHVLKAIKPLDTARTIVIVGHQKDKVESAVSDFAVCCVEQKEQNGTGHAVLCAEQSLTDFDGDVMILCGDSPLLQTEQLAEMIRAHNSSGNVLTIMTTCLENPANYGRIISSDAGNVLEVVEEKDASCKQRKIKEINAGIYLAQKTFLFDALKQLTTDNAQGEMYLTDIVAIAVRSGHNVQKYVHPCPAHVLGVNSRVELSLAHMEIQARRNRDLMDAGITMFNPTTISIAPEAMIKTDCVLSQNITISGNTTIGEHSRIDPGVCITNATIGSNAVIGPNCILTNCTLEDGTIVGPGTIVER